MTPTANSNNSAIRSGIVNRRAIMTIPIINSVVVCPKPQEIPTQNDRSGFLYSLTMVDTATTWSGSSECLDPKSIPSTKAASKPSSASCSSMISPRYWGLIDISAGGLRDSRTGTRSKCPLWQNAPDQAQNRTLPTEYP